MGVGLFGRASHAHDQDPASGDAPVDAAEAWKAIGLVNDWVKHAEAKAATTLAASGVIGGVLYNLVKSERHPSLWLSIPAVASTVGIVLAGVFVFIALAPRLKAKGHPTSLLYFEHINRAYPKGKDIPVFTERFKALVSSPDALLDQLANQIWQNARIARRKYKWVNLAMVSFGTGLIGLAAVTLRLALVSIGIADGQ